MSYGRPPRATIAAPHWTKPSTFRPERLGIACAPAEEDLLTRGCEPVRITWSSPMRINAFMLISLVLQVKNKFANKFANR